MFGGGRQFCATKSPTFHILNVKPVIMKFLNTTIITFLFPILVTAQVAMKDDSFVNKMDGPISDLLDLYIHKKMDTLHIPGLALAVVKNGEIVYSKGYGYANLELQTPMKPSHKFLIGSITKSITAVALMKLWEDGRFSLEDEIGKYIDGLPDHWKPLTIEQLLNHTSGIPTYLEAPPPCDFVFNPDNYTRMNFLQEVMCLPLDFVPGSQWKYSSATGYDLLGMIIEKLSGTSYFEYIRKNIYLPSVMNESSWIDYDSVISDRVDGYYFKNGRFHNSEQLDPIGEYAHGGLMSTTLDLIKFDDALFSYKLLKKTTLDLMLTNAKLNDGSTVTSYGLGFGLTPYGVHKRIGHTGAAPGFSTSYSRFIDEKISVFVFTNKDSDYSILKLSNEIASFFLK